MPVAEPERAVEAWLATELAPDEARLETELAPEEAWLAILEAEPLAKMVEASDVVMVEPSVVTVVRKLEVVMAEPEPPEEACVRG